MTSFITATSVNTRFANANAEAMDKAIRDINEVIKKADSFPIRVPGSLFPAPPSVRYELIRKLRDEAGWAVDVKTTAGQQGEVEYVELVGPRRGS